MIWWRRNFAGSLIGGIRTTQEMPNFYREYGITADNGRFRSDQIKTAYTRMPRSDVKDRFVIDAASLPEGA